MSYTIVKGTNDDLQRFIDTVNIKIQDGYTPLGGPGIDAAVSGVRANMYQAFIKSPASPASPASASASSSSSDSASSPKPKKIDLPLPDPDSDEMKQQIIAATGIETIYRIIDGTMAYMSVVKTRIDQGDRPTLISDDTDLILVNMTTGDILQCNLLEINKHFNLYVPSSRLYSTSSFGTDVNTRYYAFYPTMPSIHTGRNPYQGGGSRRKYGKSKRAKSYKLAHR